MHVKNGSKDLKRYPQFSRRVRDTLARLLITFWFYNLLFKNSMKTGWNFLLENTIKKFCLLFWVWVLGVYQKWRALCIYFWNNNYIINIYARPSQLCTIGILATGRIGEDPSNPSAVLNFCISASKYGPKARRTSKWWARKATGYYGTCFSRGIFNWIPP